MCSRGRQAGTIAAPDRTAAAGPREHETNSLPAGRRVSGRYFRSSGYLADGTIPRADGGVVPLAALPPFLRTLLVTDGTVTKSLEAYFWEPVAVRPIRHARLTLAAPEPGLAAAPGAAVLRREVSLTGQSSGRCYACARSVLALDELAPRLRAGVVEGRIGIGELLREQGVETYREIFDLSWLPAGTRHDPLLAPLAGDIVARAYRIRVGGSPAIVVREFFPLDLYRS